MGNLKNLKTNVNIDAALRSMSPEQLAELKARIEAAEADTAGMAFAERTGNTFLTETFAKARQEEAEVKNFVSSILNGR